eukprot:5327494-Alexandrium_andersonii.AAC.1
MPRGGPAPGLRGPRAASARPRRIRGPRGPVIPDSGGVRPSQGSRRYQRGRSPVCAWRSRAPTAQRNGGGRALRGGGA